MSVICVHQVLPEPKFPPRNPELEARIQKLKAEQAEREYKKMTENVDGQQGLARDSAAAGLDQPIGKQSTYCPLALFLCAFFLSKSSQFLELTPTPRQISLSKSSLNVKRHYGTGKICERIREYL